MSDYRRYYIPGGTYFFTVVTHERLLLFRSPRARNDLRSAIADVRVRWPFRLFAMVLLPDHLHAIWMLPRGDARYSLRWQEIKEGFRRMFELSEASEGRRSMSRRRRQERGYWQRRFWEHTIESEDDLKACVDCIHFNPVKHGLVERVADYPWSTFHRFVRLGEYEVGWGNSNPCPGFTMPE